MPGGLLAGNLPTHPQQVLDHFLVAGLQEPRAQTENRPPMPGKDMGDIHASQGSEGLEHVVQASAAVLVRRRKAVGKHGVPAEEAFGALW